MYRNIMLKTHKTTSINLLRKQYKRAARELVYPEWVQEAIDNAESEEDISKIMLEARKECRYYGR